MMCLLGSHISHMIANRICVWLTFHTGWQTDDVFGLHFTQDVKQNMFGSHTAQNFKHKETERELIDPKINTSSENNIDIDCLQRNLCLNKQQVIFNSRRRDKGAILEKFIINCCKIYSLKNNFIQQEIYFNR